MSARQNIVAAAAVTAVAITGGTALASARATDVTGQAPTATKQEARFAAASAVVAAHRVNAGPRAEVEAMAAAKAAAPSFREQLAGAKADALAAKYTPAYAKSYAKSYMQQKYGWGAGEFSALVSLWNRESGWDHTAMNPTSGAYGIPQSLPAGKMSSEGDDWRTNPRTQIRWGLKYIQSTYGSPSATVAFWDSNGWY